MKLRKITSLTAGLTFIAMVVTSVILYIVPQGRIAYWEPNLKFRPFQTS